MNIGMQIKALRTEKHATQEELAGQLGVSAQAVSKWETGASLPDVTLLPQLAAYFGVAIDELFSNIARYAYPDGPGKATVGIEFDEENRMCSVVFSDEGIPFDPLAQQAPDTSLPLMDRPVGGLGIFLVKKTMDAMAYEYKFSQNVLTIEKKLS